MSEVYIVWFVVDGRRSAIKAFADRAKADAYVSRCMRARYDVEGNEQLSYAEALGVTSMDVEALRVEA